MPSATAQFKPAYKLFLKYSSSWGRMVSRDVRFSWVHGLFIFLERRGAPAPAACFREVKHLELKFDGHYLPNMIPLNHMPYIQRLGVQGRGDFTSFRSAYAGIWSRLRELKQPCYRRCRILPSSWLGLKSLYFSGSFIRTHSCRASPPHP
ncbi:hypothetical protein FA13DRAFT_833622 [Coprinellus micaceus]|uniref:Uncharacterized protein n=1 Tax=Coprinellus micaceus TaxID=71717 RepID=A0A4Y7S2I8_COPMI|nr:hypothetical protein FA13DRAFT_833622 [Coprinellus micaceus]